MSENFPKPTSRPGIQAVHVNSAREMVNLHVQGRNPRQTNSNQLHGRVATQLRARGAESAANATEPPQKAAQSEERPQISGTGISQASSRAPPSPLQTSHPNVLVPAKDHQGECNNPQCGHCGQVIIPLPKATFPFHEKPSITVNDWSIYTMKGPILLSNELDYLNSNRFEFPLPEMIFGNNYVRIVNDKTQAVIEFNTLDALDSLNDTADFKVSYYKEWLSTRPKASASQAETDTGSTKSDLESVKPYDWTYSTNYRGSVTDAKFESTGDKIPLEKLLRPDPILFFDESILFEDELGDNGIAMLSTKVRVMHSCLLLLCRFYLRVDDVAFRVRDTRVYVDFETNEVLREYKTQEAQYDELLTKVNGRSSDPKKLLRDSNWVSQNMPVTSCDVERLS
ncbi:CIC11C00000002741 [Sungouiella intermedia]|uniref:CIC11C00000002741 n=1 Tax=Sungouiella intermedia TaxID=45354 RepID=A0A1L0BE45_9ASCO|nr:CIC11C00000002741 [[Candida] intermedia]